VLPMGLLVQAVVLPSASSRSLLLSLPPILQEMVLITVALYLRYRRTTTYHHMYV
jgi:hypothetical protein